MYKLACPYVCICINLPHLRSHASNSSGSQKGSEAVDGHCSVWLTKGGMEPYKPPCLQCVMASSCMCVCVWLAVLMRSGQSFSERIILHMQISFHLATTRIMISSFYITGIVLSWQGRISSSQCQCRNYAVAELMLIGCDSRCSDAGSVVVPVGITEDEGLQGVGRKIGFPSIEKRLCPNPLAQDNRGAHVKSPKEGT